MGKYPSMVNHVRTLLLNEPGEHIPDGSPYDSYIPEYLPLRRDGISASIENLLFARATTQQQRRARVSTMIRMVYAAGYGEWLELLDPRSIYTPGRRIEARERSHAEAMLSAVNSVTPSTEFKLWDVPEWFVPRELLLKHRAAGVSAIDRTAAFILLYLNYLTWHYQRREAAKNATYVPTPDKDKPPSVDITPERLEGWEREIDWDTILDWDEVI